MFEAKIIMDSIGPCEKRLITVEATYPRFVHSELLTHRSFARNSGSSRAIPWATMCERIKIEPVIPIKWGKNQKGMKTGEEVDQEAIEKATKIWLEARDNALVSAQALNDLGIHKSLCNRIVEPWMFITIIISATEWRNFFRLRVHEDAEIHFQKIARMIKDQIENSTPKKLLRAEWHLPFIDSEDDEIISSYIKENNLNSTSLDIAKKCSVARCARVSYVQHGDKKRSIEKDLGLFQTLITGSGFGHYSPFEHQAQATNNSTIRSGPFIGWYQLRKEYPNENVEGI